MKTVAYLRVSSEEQAKTGLGIDVQKEKIIALAREKKLEVAKFYIDKGLSGSLKDRPGLNELLRDIEINGIENVLTYSLDRLARNLALSILIENEFKKNSITLYTVLESTFDLNDPFQKFIKHTREGIAELEADLARLRTEGALRKKLARGEYPSGPAPIGFNWIGEKPHRTIRIDDKGSEVVKFIFRTYLELRSLGKVQRELERKGIRTVNTKEFSRESIRKILRNPIYKGRFKRFNTDQRIEAIIFIRTWNKAQVLLDKRAYKRVSGMESSQELQERKERLKK